MITPAIIALYIITFSVAGMVLLATHFAWKILCHWNINSGSELQLRLEQQTYLVSTLLSFALGAELLSLLLFVHMAENLSSQFVGAMCATGVLNISIFGFPTLLLKIILFFLAALWLTINHIDNKGCDYPLVRIKYSLLLSIAPLVVLELVVQTHYFLGLKPNVITSCCGSLFSADSQSIAATLASFSVKPAIMLFYIMAAILLISGLAFLRWLWLGILFAIISMAGFAMAIIAIIAFVSLYIYESPLHHCPFCLLKSGYGYIGYYLYLPLFAATVFGLNAGVLSIFRHISSLRIVIAAKARQFTVLALFGFGSFYIIASWLVLRSHLIIPG